MTKLASYTTLQNALAKLPVVGPTAKKMYGLLVPDNSKVAFDTSSKYWDDRYSLGGNSGAGSYGRLALFKAEIVNNFVSDNRVGSVIEFGCGDGAQLELARYPKYIGIDVSQRAVEICQARFSKDPSKEFIHSSMPAADTTKAELAMSLDVIYHLVEDDIYDAYMKRLVSSAERFLCVYSSNLDSAPDSHIRHRCFTEWLARRAPSWKVMTKVPNRYPADPARPDDTSWAEFYFFAKG